MIRHQQGDSKREVSASIERTPVKKRKSVKAKFGGMSEEEVMQLKLPDRICFNMDILFVSTVYNTSLTRQYSVFLIKKLFILKIYD